MAKRDSRKWPNKVVGIADGRKGKYFVYDARVLRSGKGGLATMHNAMEKEGYEHKEAALCPRPAHIFIRPKKASKKRSGRKPQGKSKGKKR